MGKDLKVNSPDKAVLEIHRGCSIIKYYFPLHLLFLFLQLVLKPKISLPKAIHGTATSHQHHIVISITGIMMVGQKANVLTLDEISKSGSKRIINAEGKYRSQEKQSSI